MMKRLLLCAAVLLALPIRPLRADYTDLQPTTAAVVDDLIIIQVDNPNTTAESASIQVAVQVEDGSTEILTTATVTVDGSSTVFVSARASAPIVQIIDEPDPISP